MVCLSDFSNVTPMLHCLALMGTVEVFTLIFEFNQVVGEKDAEKTLTSIF